MYSIVFMPLATIIADGNKTNNSSEPFFCGKIRTKHKDTPRLKMSKIQLFLNLLLIDITSGVFNNNDATVQNPMNNSGIKN